MKYSTYTLQIRKPCQQDWFSMKEYERGRFCSQCLKNVEDFTKLTDKEIISKVERASGEICGRLTKNQINRKLIIRQQQTNTSSFSKLLTGLFLLSAYNYSYASNKPHDIKIFETKGSSEREQNHNELELKVNTEKDSLLNIIEGRLIDAETKEPLGFASIIFKNTKVGVAADVDGNFKLTVPDSLMAENIYLEVLYVGYERKEIVIKQTDLPIKQNYFVIQAEQIILGGVCITRSKKWWQFWKKKY